MSCPCREGSWGCPLLQQLWGCPVQTPPIPQVGIFFLNCSSRASLEIPTGSPRGFSLPGVPSKASSQPQFTWKSCEKPGKGFSLILGVQGAARSIQVTHQRDPGITDGGKSPQRWCPTINPDWVLTAHPCPQVPHSLNISRDGVSTTAQGSSAGA